MRPAEVCPVARVRVGQASAMTIEGGRPDQLAGRRPGLEQDDQPHCQSGRGPGGKARPRAEAEVAARGGRSQQVVEIVDRAGLVGGRPGLDEAGRILGVRPRPAIPPDDLDPGLLALPDQLPGRLRDRREIGRLGPAGLEGQGDPVAGGLDLLDRPEAIRLDQPAIARRRRDLGVGGHHVDTMAEEPAGRGGQALGGPLDRLAGRNRAFREVGPGARDRPPGPLERQQAIAVVGHQEARPPAERCPLLGPGPRLVDVAARRIDRVPVPIEELVAGGLGKPHAEIVRRRTTAIARATIVPSSGIRSRNASPA